MTTKMPIPYTALNAENNISERNAGELVRRVKNVASERSCMIRHIPFTSKYNALTHNKPSKQSGSPYEPMQSASKSTIRLNGGFCASCLRLEKGTMDANGRCADCATMQFAID